jgi:hypothetical protein
MKIPSKYFSNLIFSLVQLLDPAAVLVIVTIELAHEATAVRHHRSAQTAVLSLVVAQRAHVTMIRVYQNPHVVVTRAARAHAQNQTVHVQSHEAKAVIHAMETIKRKSAPLIANLTRFFDYNFFHMPLFHSQD